MSGETNMTRDARVSEEETLSPGFLLPAPSSRLTSYVTLS